MADIFQANKRWIEEVNRIMSAVPASNSKYTQAAAAFTGSAAETISANFGKSSAAEEKQSFLDWLGSAAGAAAGALVKAKVGGGADVVQKTVTGNKTITETVSGVASGKLNPVEELKTNVKGTAENIPGSKYLPLILAGGAALVAVSILKK